MGVWEYGSERTTLNFFGVRRSAFGVKRSAFRVRLSALCVKKPLGVAENPSPELPFFTR